MERFDFTLAKKQYEYFIPSDSHGLTSAGLSRINQNIEVFVFCILGAQVSARSGITGNSGSAVEVRREFLALLEDSIRKPNISASIERFQLAVQEARVKLDLAISPGTWLLPARMVINTASKIGYNNELRRASPHIRLGVNDNVNVGIKQTGIPKHNFATSKNELPHAIETESKKHETEHTTKTLKINNRSLINSVHEINLVVLTISAAGLAWLVFVSIIQLKNCLTYFQKLKFKTFGKNLNLKLNYIQPKKVQNCPPAGRTETPSGIFFILFLP